MNIRRIKNSEWPLVKELRLKSLESDPEIFWEDIEVVQEYKDNYWKDLAIELTKENGSIMFLIEENEKALGSIYGIKKDDDNYSIGGLWIDSRYRNKGLGSKLLKEVVNWVKARKTYSLLKLWSPNDSTIDFYKQFGFVCLDNIKTNPDNKNIQIIEMELKIYAL